MSLLGMSSYPCVPGHELAGVAVAVGSKVTRVKVGDHVGVGCMVDSCGKCGACKRGEEQMGISQTGTYNAVPAHDKAAVFPPKSRTLGGYSDKMVIHENFAIVIPKSYPLEYAGPVMCAGVTLFDPLRRYGATNGSKVAVVGIGGLGVMGIKLAKAMGCIVTAISRSPGKETFAKECGASFFINSGHLKDLASAASSFDLVLNTIPSEHDYTIYSTLTKRKGGKHIILGLNSALVAGMVANGILCGSRVKGSGIGGIEATQAVIDLCAKHDIRPEIKLINVDQINETYTILDSNNDAGVRHVIDLSTLNATAAERCNTVKPPTLSHGLGLTAGGVVGAIVNLIFLGRWW